MFPVLELPLPDVEVELVELVLLTLLRFLGSLMKLNRLGSRWKSASASRLKLDPASPPRALPDVLFPPAPARFAPLVLVIVPPVTTIEPPRAVPVVPELALPPAVLPLPPRALPEMVTPPFPPIAIDKYQANEYASLKIGGKMNVLELLLETVLPGLPFMVTPPPSTFPELPVRVLPPD